jgi:K+-sensing histidine kinase KdpD
VGVGLGLALVRELVQLHHGEIHANSKGQGLGSTFVVKLPLAAVPENLRSRPPISVSDPGLSAMPRWRCS